MDFSELLQMKATLSTAKHLLLLAGILCESVEARTSSVICQWHLEELSFVLIPSLICSSFISFPFAHFLDLLRSL